MSEEEWQAHVKFATVSVRNFGGASGDLTLKPLTILYGPPESGVSHMASLMHAFVVHGSSLSVYDDRFDIAHSETDFFEPVTKHELEALRVMEKRRQKVKFTDSKYLADSARKHLHLLALGLEAGLLGSGSPLRPDASGSTVILGANRAHGRLEYTDDGLAEFPDRPNLRINFVTHGTARKHGKKHDAGSGPYLVRDPYHYAGPRPYESGSDIHIDAHRSGGISVLGNVLTAALYYYSERVSQPKWSVLVSNGGLTEYEIPQYAGSEDMIFGIIARNKTAHISGDTPLKKLQSALDNTERRTMIVIENPERYVADTESFVRTLFEKANEGLYMLVVTGDQTLAERVATMRRESGGLDAEYAAVYGFEQGNGGHAIIEY